MAIDRVVMWIAAAGIRLQMGDDLMAEEIEVDPLRRAAAFGAAERRSVKMPGGSKVVNRKSDMKGSKRHGVLLALILRCVPREIAFIEI
jgi:predicted regulator of amino acid metabolism with ACT domain